MKLPLPDGKELTISEADLSQAVARILCVTYPLNFAGNNILLYLREFGEATLYAIAKHYGHHRAHYRHYTAQKRLLIEREVIGVKEGKLFLRQNKAGKAILDLTDEAVEEQKNPRYNRLAGQRPRKNEHKLLIGSNQAVSDYALQRAQENNALSEAEMKKHLPRLITEELNALVKQTSKPAVKKQIAKTLLFLEDFEPNLKPAKNQLNTKDVNKKFADLEKAFSKSRRADDGRLPVKTEILIEAFIRSEGREEVRCFIDKWSSPYKSIPTKKQ